MTETRENGLSQDALFSLLSNPRRRFILRYLNRTDESIQLQDLAAEVAAWENETDREALTSKQRKRLYVSLYQTHIPKLEEAGIVEYDGDTGQIRLTDRGGDLNRYLDVDAPDADGTRRWGRYYLLLALVVALAYGALAVGGGPLDRTGVVVIGVGWVLLAGLAAVHYLKTERDDGR
ncbi:hypothetical protein DM2_1452 [Halorubrum sp. DM2]|uniref:DUF7344 domain-containing protein n=2 Tax=unclassified Halorubrum TaxID=2642239 RepID=UPI0024B85DD6|nr:hypothetical protein [Halorubrum sp. DM2]VTT88118.1 hypothetical protein DM2_1452 [Halorubrum sp. DM2]